MNVKPRSSHASTPTPASVVQTSPLAGFKFSSIGQNPSLLDRMGDNVNHSPERELSQDRTGSSLSFSRRGLSQSQTTGTPPVERDSPVNSTVQHQSNALGSTPMSTHSESHDVRFPHLHDQRRTSSVIPDLQYPIAAPDNDSWLSPADQSAPMDQDSLPPRRPSMPQNSAAASASGGGSLNGVTNSPASSTLPQRSRSQASTEPEQLRQPVEHLIKLASVREDRMSRQREIFDLRSGELSAFSSDASRATKTVQDQMDLVKLHAEELHAQAGQMLQEANKTRELADRMIASIETLYVDVPNATKCVDHLVERSDQMTSFMRKTFDWLAALRVREQGKVDAIQVELAEQALAEINRLARMQEERRKAEAQEKAAQREEEEREAAKKKAEEEDEAARMRLYVVQRAAVMEQKRKASETQAQSIQAERERAERERRLADVSGSGSNAPNPFPGVAPEHTGNAWLSTSLTLPPVVPSPTRSPTRSRGQLEVSTSLSQLSLSPNKARAVPASVNFVPAQTEVGRTVNTDSPFSSTTLASELHPRIVEPSQRPPSNHLAHVPAQDQMPWQESRRMTPKLEQRPVEIKREPSVEELPATRSQAPPSQPSPQIADMDDGRQRHFPISRRTPSQDRNGDQRNQASSRPPSRANSLYVAQSEERRHSDPSAPVLPEEDSLTRSRDSLYDRAPQSTEVRGRTRQDSISSDRSPSRWNDRDRRSRSPAPRRPLSRSPSPYARKRVRSGTPRYDSRQAPDYWRTHWRPPVVDRDRGRDRQFYDYDREGSPRRYRLPPRRTDTYRPSPSPAPPSPREYHRYERASPRPGYRSPSPEYERRFVGSDAQGREPERINTNVRQYEPTSEAEVRHAVEREEQQRWQRPTPSPSDRDRTPTPPPRLAEAEVGLLDRIDMNLQAEYRGRGRGRLPPGGAMRGGPNSRRGLRGGLRGRGVVSEPTLLTRMTGATIRGGIRPAHAPSLSDRMQQD